MAVVVYRALWTWFIALDFAVFLVLKVDGKIDWNWFLIFTPLWCFDMVVVIYLVVHMIIHCKNGHNRTHTYDLTMKRRCWFLVAVILKMTFQVLLCLRLQYFKSLSLYYVMIPFWLLASLCAGDIFKGLVSIHYGQGSVSSAVHGPSSSVWRG